MTKVRFFCSFPTTLTRRAPLGTLCRRERDNTPFSPTGEGQGMKDYLKTLILHLYDTRHIQGYWLNVRELA
jgi:hypothetical protein